MSRPAQLPPRFPNPIKGHQQQYPAPNNPSPARYLGGGGGGDERLPPLHRFPSQDSFFDEQALWLEGLLDDSGSSSSRSGSSGCGPTPLRRAVSDPVGMLEESMSFDFSPFCSSPLFNDDDGLPRGGGGGDGEETARCKDADDLLDKITACSGLDSGSLYGPNSPRKMKNLTESESSVVSAAFENVSWGNPFQYVSVNPPLAGGAAADAGNKADSGFMSANAMDQDRAVKRHTGQRSRVRKLQYIADLERTVNLYQAMEADLAAKVASLFRQRAVLSVENNNLKQQLAGLKKEKMMKDGEYRYLDKEVKKLKAARDGRHPHHRKSMSSSSYPMAMGPMATSDSSSEANWSALDIAMGNLGLKETLPMKYGFRS